jgi:hypothetical protein
MERTLSLIGVLLLSGTLVAGGSKDAGGRGSAAGGNSGSARGGNTSSAGTSSAGGGKTSTASGSNSSKGSNSAQGSSAGRATFSFSGGVPTLTLTVTAGPHGHTVNIPRISRDIPDPARNNSRSASSGPTGQQAGQQSVDGSVWLCASTLEFLAPLPPFDLLGYHIQHQSVAICPPGKLPNILTHSGIANNPDCAFYGTQLGRLRFEFETHRQNVLCARTQASVDCVMERVQSYAKLFDILDNNCQHSSEAVIRECSPTTLGSSIRPAPKPGRSLPPVVGGR